MICRNVTKDNNLVFCNSEGLNLPTAIQICIENEVVHTFDLSTLSQDTEIESVTYTATDTTTVTLTNLLISCYKSKQNRIKFTYTCSKNISIIYVNNNNYQVRFNAGNNVDVDEVWMCSSIKNVDFVENEKAVASALIQKLSICKGELWFAINYGLPLFEKTTSRGIFDSRIALITSKQTGVLEIQSFSSKVEKTNYYASMNIKTLYGDVSLSINR